MDENKPTSSDSPELDVDSEPGEGDVSKDNLEAEPTEYYKTLTGREDIKSKEDFEKHYKGLQSLVGDKTISDLRKKAEAYESYQKKVGSQTDEFLKTKDGKETLKDFQKDAEAERIVNLEKKFEDSEFLRKNPDVEPYLNLIRTVADSKEVSLGDAYGELKEIITSKIESDKSKQEEKNSSVNSKTRLSSSKSGKLSSLVDSYSKNPTDEVAAELVKEYLSE